MHIFSKSFTLSFIMILTYKMERTMVLKLNVQNSFVIWEINPIVYIFDKMSQKTFGYLIVVQLVSKYNIGHANLIRIID